jgi:hypothetical protein
VSIVNYGYDLLMINQWEDITQLECEYKMTSQCVTTGDSVLQQENINPVRLRLILEPPQTYHGHVLMSFPFSIFRLTDQLTL